MANLFGGGERPKAPVVSPPARMPDPFDPAVMEAKRRAAADALARGGRQSTILGGNSRAGIASVGQTFDSYSGKVLGA
jgi:hypothetical protein